MEGKERKRDESSLICYKNKIVNEKNNNNNNNTSHATRISLVLKVGRQHKTSKRDRRCETHTPRRILYN